MKPLLALLFTLALCSCGPVEDEDVNRWLDSTAQMNAMVRTRDSTKMMRLLELRDSVVNASFYACVNGKIWGINAQSIPDLYYHQSYTKLWGDPQRMTMFVDRHGDIGFVTSFEDPTGMPRLLHNLILATASDTVYLFQVVREQVAGIDEVAPKYSCMAFMSLNNNAAKFITEHRDETITVNAMDDKTVYKSFTLQEKDRELVSEYLLLADILREYDGLQ